MNRAAFASAQDLGTAPFPGLRPFSFNDHVWFFGREDQTFSLCALLLRNHFVAVIGSSGSGKSSIVRAGLLPQLHAENERSGKDTWRWLTMRPGRDPIGHLAQALADLGGGVSQEARRSRIEASLRSSSRGIFDALAHNATDPAAQLVLVVDQFEELFRYLSAGPKHLDRAEAMQRRDETTEFVQLLLTATQSHDSKIRVVITMRSDFIGDCALFQGLPEAVSAAQFLVPSLSKDQRREAIREPVKRANATIDPELVERLVEDSDSESDQLPVLQHCLARLWTRADPADALSQAEVTDEVGAAPDRSKPVRRLTVHDYEEIGGLAGALSGHAEEILDTLPGQERTVEQIFRALGEVDKDGRAIRRARPLAQLVDETFIDQQVNRESVCRVLDRFRADDCSFIVPPVSTALTDRAVIDVGHEALLRRWKRVCGDPEATGERADKRDIGWLRQEQRDGESYQFLRSCVDPDSPNDSQLPANQVERYSKWWASRKPNPAWAARYGGKFDDVKRLVRESYKHSQRMKWAKILSSAVALIAIVAMSVVLFTTWERQRSAEAVFELTLTSAEKLSQMVLDAFNYGQLSAGAGSQISKEAVELYRNTNKLKEAPSSIAAESRWLLVSSDFSFALGNKQSARSDAMEAMAHAERYLDADSGNRRWQELLYGSLFRIGDLDLDQSVAEHDRNRAEMASAAYEKCRRIAEEILSKQTPAPGRYATADVDALAKQRFDLAFAINKVGEAKQVLRDTDGAIANYRDALDLAVLIESASRVEQKLQSATTRIKIAGALVRQKNPDLDGAVRYYSEAIEREEKVLTENSTDNVVRSNLGVAYEGRAQVYLQNREFDLGFKGYAQAAELISRLTAEDPKDTKWLERLAQVQSKFGKALEEYARSRNAPLDQAIEQYQAEVTTRTKLAERGPANAVWQKNLITSRERLQGVSATAVPEAASTR
jgi:tetratricopeptide (TPR) repeat protein